MGVDCQGGELLSGGEQDWWERVRRAGEDTLIPGIHESDSPKRFSQGRLAFAVYWRYRATLVGEPS